ncbi:hypothetical protein XACLE20_130077 [Xanthomonas citri pv. citri]|nr:hypothetical protein XAC3824_110108 [Xanthomonas citri pv. citri]CEE17430.1 hypothetical protein XAC902_100108 [Xanthomonas citri pv. citri]CEE50601.1 hypothetical protein XAC71A_110107 [Xanthomonas citri pv. citri]CEE68367.1 hypothetical protein XACLE20_130077 [Xanthomonas citri pv. citri]CEF21974.1 hypothetical protein XACJK2_150077 [Xanthomonas citri pv. citri]
MACGVGDADNSPVSISPKHLQILYQDDVLAVVDKPAGLMVHDSKLARGEDDFLADRLREQLGKPTFWCTGSTAPPAAACCWPSIATAPVRWARL